MDKDSKSLKLFFSYGHEERNKIIVGMIWHKLADERHHEIWIDETSIPHASDWRREIQSGINGSDRVIAFLSKYAMRKDDGVPGVCLDELSIAVCIPEKTIVTVLLEPEKEVPSPPTISSIQRIDMSDWYEKYETGGKVFEEYFESKIALIIEVIESEEIFAFHGEIEGLRKSLLPTAKGSKYYALLDKPMIGREWLLYVINSYFKNRNKKRTLCIYGGPGYGKSHFTATAIHFQPQVVAGYFFEWSKQNKNSVKEFICSVAFQMATMLPDYRLELIRKLKDYRLFVSTDDDKGVVGDASGKNRDKLFEKTDEALFAFLISDVKNIDGGSGNKLIVIDGVDEAELDGNNPLVALLCSDSVKTLPKYFKFIITSRKEESIRLSINSMDAEVIDLENDESEKDIEAYLHYRLDGYISDGRIEPEIIGKIIKRCEKTFIFAEKLCDAYDEDNSILSNLHILPKTVDGLYYLYFQRLFKNESYDSVKKALSVITANNGEISKKLLCGIMNWSASDMSGFMQKMRAFVKESLTETVQNVGFYHKTISEWITDRLAAGEYTVEAEQGRNYIREFCDSCFEMIKQSDFSWGFDGHNTALPYETLRFVFEKINEFGSGMQRRQLMTDMKFLYCLQLEAYRNSALSFADRIAGETEKNYKFLSSAQKSALKKYIAGSKVLLAESELARNNEKKALGMFEKIREEYEDIFEKEIALYCCVERNICFLSRKIDPEKAERRLAALLEMLDNRDWNGSLNDKAQCCYHLSVILYDRKKIEEAKEAALDAIELAVRTFDEPMRLCVLAYNQIGSCYWALSEQHKDEKELYIDLIRKEHEYKKKSLDERLALYGKYSRYTALGYDYMARAHLDLHRALGERLSDEAYDCAENAAKIYEYVLGNQSAGYARALQTKALLLEYDFRFTEAKKFAEESMKIYISYGEHEKAAIERAKMIFDRIKNEAESESE